MPIIAKLYSRGGVEDPTFEAKAESSKHPRPRTDFSITEPLETKEKNARCQRPRTQFFKLCLANFLFFYFFLLSTKVFTITAFR